MNKKKRSVFLLFCLSDTASVTTATWCIFSLLMGVSVQLVGVTIIFSVLSVNPWKTPLCLLSFMHVPSSFHHIFSLLHLKKTSSSLSGELVICRELLVCCGAAPGVSVLEVQGGALTLILRRAQPTKLWSLQCQYKYFCSHCSLPVKWCWSCPRLLLLREYTWNYSK